MESILPKTRRKINDPLVQYSSNTTSQGGEDGILTKIFQVVPTAREKWCVEFGAWDGKHWSNTWCLLHESDWHGVLIEADELRYKQLCDNYALYPKVHCVKSLVALDGEHRLDAILELYKVPFNIDLISIDIDGADYHVWDGLVKYSPNVVVIEFNPSIPNHVVFVQPRDMNIYQGSSLRALIVLGKEKGYELVSTTMFNGIFVKKEYYCLFNMKDNHIDVMHDVPMQMDMYQLFDGTIKLSGCKKLIWRNIPIDEEKLQILPNHERQFPYAPPGTQDDLVQVAKELAKRVDQELDHILILADEMVSQSSRYAVKDIAQVYEYCVGAQPELLLESIVEKYVQYGDKAMEVQQTQKRAMQWYKAAVLLKVEADEHLLQKLGECYIRLRAFRKAEYWLLQSKSLRPTRKCLKSLAKLYTKLERPKAAAMMVDQLLNLEASKMIIS